jgi:hypothetical protein
MVQCEALLGSEFGRELPPNPTPEQAWAYMNELWEGDPGGPRLAGPGTGGGHMALGTGLRRLPTVESASCLSARSRPGTKPMSAGWRSAPAECRGRSSRSAPGYQPEDPLVEALGNAHTDSGGSPPWIRVFQMTSGYPRWLPWRQVGGGCGGCRQDFARLIRAARAGRAPVWAGFRTSPEVSARCAPAQRHPRRRPSSFPHAGFG